MNINELKKQLQNLGISTSTPGLNGDERFEELSFRLESSQNAFKVVNNSNPVNQSDGGDSFVVPSLNQLTIGEIRSRLTALGESTATPGVTGEERRVALMRRLIDAVCINDEGTNISSIASTIVADTLKPSPAKKIESPVKVENKPVLPVSPPAAQIPLEEIAEIEVTAAKISALKNDLKRLVNQRAMAVASKLSGNLQDEALKLCEAKLARIENEIAQMKALLQKGESKLPAEGIQSEFLVLNPATTIFTIDSLIGRLEGYRSSTKDKIREHRLRIREEGDAHPQFGVAVEEKLKIQLSDANLAATKIPVGKNATSRARQKLTEVKDIETQLQQQGHIKEAPASPTPSSSNPNANGMFGAGTQVSGPAATVGATAAVSNAAGSVGAGSAVSAGRGAPGTSPKDKAPVHNPNNKIQAGVSAKSPPLRSLDNATLSASGKSKPIDKWSMDITPSMRLVPALAEQSSKADNLASKLPELTSSFLGKAIDLDSVSQKAKSNNELGEVTKMRAPVVLPAGDTKNAVKEEPAVAIQSSSDIAEQVPPASSTAFVLWPADDPTSPPSSPPAEPPIEPESSVPQMQTGAMKGSVGSIKVSSAKVTAPPVIPGRRPPPPIDASSSSQKPPGANLVPSVQAPATVTTATATAGVHISAEEDAAFDFHIAEFDADHEEYFREANEAESRKDTRAPGVTPSLKDIKEMHPVRRATPKRSTRQLVSDDDEDPVVHTALSASRDSDYDNTHETAGEYNPEDDNLEDDNDYGGIYGSHRRLVTEEEDDDLEELPGSRSSRSPSVRSPVRPLSSSDGDGTSSRLDPLPESRSPLESRSGSQDENHELEEQPSGSENTYHMHGAPIHHLPSIDEDDDAKSDVHASPSPQKTKRPIYNLAGNLENTDDEGEKDAEATEHQDANEEDEGERLGDEKIQIRVLRSHAKVLEGLNDVNAAEAVHMRALELDPTNISTLEGFAQFLHQKKGELARAEAFFNRGLQVCLPGLVLKTGDSAKNTPQSGRKSLSRMSFSTDGTMQGSKIKHIIKFILSYAHFLSKAKGDIEGASILYKKGVDLCPEDALLLATYAHFLAQVGDKDSNNAAADYFQRALKISPGNAQYAMWYGKLLKKMGKTGQAELMYKVALERSKGNEALEPTAMCNYATFVFKQRRDPERAHVLFQAGLAVYPGHKGLRKNYAALVKAHPQFATGDAPAEPAKRESKSAQDRAQRQAQSAMDSINEEAIPHPPVASEEGEESS